ncbi:MULTISPECIES: hypothetical protein [Shewanella]|uniref:hypothetical protein n=1 Tax=Shewanella sp. 8A TaxID=2943323 RepID=UPI00201B01E4|nr:MULTISPECIES: hypothetical protein [Shewanella]MDL3987310.1 hypothetical protein [Shewanella xiamenensis]
MPEHYRIVLTQQQRLIEHNFGQITPLLIGFIEQGNPPQGMVGAVVTMHILPMGYGFETANLHHGSGAQLSLRQAA